MSQDWLGEGGATIKLSSFQGLENWLSYFYVQKFYPGNLLKMQMSKLYLKMVWGGGASLGISM